MLTPSYRITTYSINEFKFFKFRRLYLNKMFSYKFKNQKTFKKMKEKIDIDEIIIDIQKWLEDKKYIDIYDKFIYYIEYNKINYYILGN